MSQAPPVGQVLGIDVGFSPTEQTTCFCGLQWTEWVVTPTFELTTSDVAERRRALAQFSGASLWAVAIDGPLVRDLRLVTHYRAAEAILSRGVLQKRGKPGQTSSPVGQQLHLHATALANLVLEATTVESAKHWDAIHERCVVEAFPNAFLAAMVRESCIPTLKRDASDRYWEALVDRSEGLAALIARLLPNRSLEIDLKGITNHDHRAGLICALTALAVVANDYVAVGDPSDGEIVLPPLATWGSGDHGEPWLESVLRSNLSAVRHAPGCQENHREARILTPASCWLSLPRFHRSSSTTSLARSSDHSAASRSRTSSAAIAR